ncbi:hypothetical protein A2U01_0113899, partial [Trifolium medium]|nr:hypothetical protein [Trifolium medium]
VRFSRLARASELQRDQTETNERQRALSLSETQARSASIHQTG